jgi:hypothetical protein
VVQPLATQVVFEHMTLAGTRAKIARLQAAIGELSERPQPADDVKQRVRRYVSELGQAAQPAIHGIGVGWNEKLAVTWPHDMTMMQLMAALVPDRLIGHILAAIQDQTNAPLSPQEQQRLVQMRVEVEDLRYAEEQLVTDEGGTRSPDVPPWAVLQCVVAGGRSARVA